MSPPGGYFHTELWGGVFRTRNWVVMCFGAIAILLGLWGFSVCHATDCQTASFGEKLFRTIDLVRLSSHYTPDHDPWPLVLAQLMMPLAVVAGAIRLFILNMRRDLKVVLVRRMRDHMIVCGLGDTGRHIAESLADAGHRVVAISRDNQDANAIACERRGIVVLQGDGMDTALQRVAGLRRATTLFVACGADATNIEVALRADALAAKRSDGTPLSVWVELRNEWLYSQIVSHRNRLTLTGAAHFRLFNLNANAARRLLQTPGFAHAAAGAPAPHLLVLGQGQTLKEVIIQAVQGLFALPDQRLAVTLAAKNAQGVLDSIALRYPGLASAADLTALNCGFDDDIAWPELADSIASSSPFAAVIDLEDEVASMRVALRLRRLLDAANLYATPLYLRVWRQNRLGNFLQSVEKDASQPDRLAVFGDLESLTQSSELLAESIDLLASATHEAYRQTAGGPTWHELSEQSKQSNRDFADHISVKLRAIGLTLDQQGVPAALGEDEIEQMARTEHWRWCNALRLKGWRQGPRDEFRRTHPLLTNWETLDEHSREINRQMVRRIPVIAQTAGLGIRRPETHI